MKQLIQLDNETLIQLRMCKCDSDFANLGFECKGQLCEYSGYVHFYCRLWVWTKYADENKEKVYTMVTLDEGNTYSSLVYYDVYIPDLLLKL